MKSRQIQAPKRVRMRKRRYQSERSTQSAWLFDVANLRAGDVVLERGLRWTSRIIRAADRGKYSHALIFFGGRQYGLSCNHLPPCCDYRSLRLGSITTPRRTDSRAGRKQSPQSSAQK